MEELTAEDVVSMMLNIALISGKKEVEAELAPDALWWDVLPGQPV